MIDKKSKFLKILEGREYYLRPLFAIYFIFLQFYPGNMDDFILQNGQKKILLFLNLHFTT